MIIYPIMVVLAVLALSVIARLGWEAFRFIWAGIL